MHFLGLRTQHELAKVPSFPQREIEMVGEKMEAESAELHAAHLRGLRCQRAPGAVRRCRAPFGTDVRIDRARCPYCGISRSSSSLIKRTRHCLNPRAGSAGLILALCRVPRGQTPP